jgi:ankyrin repeat protein
MRHLFFAFIFACISMQAFAFVVEPTQESTHSKQAAHKKATFSPPSTATLGFFQAALYTNFDMMELYLGRGADINCRNCDSEGNTPLHRALSGYTAPYQSISWLVDHGANVNAINVNGITPLMLAVPLSEKGAASSSAMSQVMNLLLDRGAKIGARDIMGNTELMQLITVNDGPYNKDSKQAFTWILNSLLEHGSNINAANNRGDTLLMAAANNCADFSVDTLLARNADPAIKNKIGQTALSIAIEKATRSGQDTYCNNVVKILQSARQARQDSPMGATPQVNASAPADMGSGPYSGNYSGTFMGDDNGTFQVAIGQDGNIQLVGKSNNTNQQFTGTGRMNGDGSLGISLGRISTGATFQGSINPKTGAMYGTWKNSGLAGNFSGSKQTQSGNPLDAIGVALDGLGKLLGK